MSTKESVVIVGAARTPIGSFMGELAPLRAPAFRSYSFSRCGAGYRKNRQSAEKVLEESHIEYKSRLGIFKPLINFIFCHSILFEKQAFDQYP